MLLLSSPPPLSPAVAASHDIGTSFPRRAVRSAVSPCRSLETPERRIEILIAVHVRTGERVKPGTPLVTLSCPETPGARTALASFRAAAHGTNIALERETRMLAQRPSSPAIGGESYEPECL